MVNLSQSQIATPGVDQSQVSTWLAGDAAVRLERFDADSLTLQPCNGRTIWINGVAVVVTTTSTFYNGNDNLIDSDGVTIPWDSAFSHAQTVLYAYASDDTNNPGVAALWMSQTAPVQLDTGVWVLKATGTGLGFRFVGAAYVDGTPSFTDDEQKRGVCSWFNPRLARVFNCPGYTDDDADNSVMVNSGATYSTYNDTCWCVVLHNSAFEIHGQVSIKSNTLFESRWAVDYRRGSESAGDTPQVSTLAPATLNIGLNIARVVPGVASPASADVCGLGMGFYTKSQNVVIFTDFARNGATVDPAATYLEGWVWV